MLMDWIYWVQTLRADNLLPIITVLMMIDAPRYAWSLVLMAICDLPAAFRREVPISKVSEYSPDITVLIAGHNESKTIARTMEAVWTDCPHIQMIVVDDGSTDGMSIAAKAFAAEKPEITVIRREVRGGKSSALNLGLLYARGEVVVTIDADSRPGRGAIAELVQPLADSGIAAVSGSVRAWNPFDCLVTRLQAYEYRQTIFMSRMARARLGLLGIVSGAFGAFRTSALRHVGGWDVGPGEDGDIVLRLRKAGYRIAAAPRAECLTNVPVSWIRLFRQRCRWDRTVITFECRKHADMGFVSGRQFRWSCFLMTLERWFFNVVFVYSFWLGTLLLFSTGSRDPLYLSLLLYVCNVILELIQFLVIICYSDKVRHDLTLGVVLPLYPIYQLFLKFVDLYAQTREILIRDSGTDSFVPDHVRNATWRF